MEVTGEPDVEPLPPKGVLSYVILPFFTNLSILIFEFSAIDVYTASSDSSNVIGIVGLFAYYLGCLILFLAYGHSRGGWAEVFGLCSRCLVALLLLSYPIFFLFWLPIIICQFLLLFASPRLLWEKLFAGSLMSTDNLVPELNDSSCGFWFRYLYVGVPFVLFSLLMIVIIVFLAPLWYFVLSPFGLGTMGIALHVTLHFPQSLEGDLLERMSGTYKWGVFAHVYALALPFAIIGIAHVVIVGVTWYGVFLAVFTCLQFAIDSVPSILAVLRDTELLHD
jgi:hypothetical protein